MHSDSQSYLTIREAAELLRTSPHTVYRWCRSGRLQAVKLGKEWRIPAQQLRREGDLAGLLPLDALLAALAGRSEHLLGLARDPAALGRMEAIFFESAAAAGGRLVYGQWPKDPEGIRQRLRPVLGAAGTRESSLRIVDFPRAYERQGPAGIVKLVSRETASAKTSKRPCYVYGPPLSYFGYLYDRVVSYENHLDSAMQDMDCAILCGYAVAEVQTDASMTLLLDLIACHSGTIMFDGQRALLVRPAR